MQLKIVPDVVNGQRLAVLEPTATVQDAVTLMAERGLGAVLITHAQSLKGIFTERDVSYRVVAPGLNPLTTQLLDVMTADPVTVKPGDTALGALQSIHKGDYRHLPVVDDNQLLGVVSVRDIMACVKTQRENDFTHLRKNVIPACKIVPDLVGEQGIATLEAGASVLEAARLMAKRGIGAIMVTHEGGLKGIFTERDVALRVTAAGLDPDSVQLEQVMTADPATLSPDDEAERALLTMLEGDYRHIPVLDKMQLVGIVSIRDIYSCIEAELEQEFRRALEDRARTMAGDDL